MIKFSSYFKVLWILVCCLVNTNFSHGEEPCKVTSDLTIDKLGIALEGDQGICLKDYGAQFKVTYDDRDILDGAEYEISFTDGSKPETFTVQQLKELGGIITHKFSKSSCHVTGNMFTATVTASTCNRDVRGSSDLKTVRVLKSPTADFKVPDKVCINKPFYIEDNSESGETYSCTEAHYSDWYFDDGTNLIKQEEPYISHTFTTLGRHTIKLKVYSLNPPKECNYDSIEKTVEVIADPTLNSIADIEVCAGVRVDSITLSGTNLAKAEWENGSVVGLSYGETTKALKMPSFIARNGTASVLEREVTVTPYNELGCPGEPVKFKIKVKPSSEMEDIEDITACDGEVIDQVEFKGLVPGTTFEWEVVNDGNIGLTQKSGKTNSIPSFTAASNGNASTTKIKVTANNSDPSLAVCPSVTKEFEYKVLSVPSFTISVDSITKCGVSNGKIHLNGLAPKTSYYVTFDGYREYLKSDEKGTITNSSVKPDVYKDIKVEAGKCEYTSPDIITLVAPSAPATPEISAENSKICEGDTLRLIAKAEDGVTYRWNGPDFWTSTEQNPQRANARASYSGVYQLYVEKNNCESPTTELTVEVTEKPSIKIVNLPSEANGVCGSYQLTKDKNLRIEAENEIVSTEWAIEPKDGVSFTTNANDLSTSIQFSKSGTYKISLKYTTSCGEAEAKGVIKIDEPVQMSLASVDPVCANIITEQNTNGVTLKASPAGGTWSMSTEYNWIDGNTFYPNQPGDYYLTYSVKVASCTANDSILVKVNDYPSLYLGEDINVCEGDSDPIELTAEPNTGTWRSVYIKGTTLTPPSKAGDYTISYVCQDTNGCKSYDEKKVVVLPTPSPEFGPDFICLPNEAVFEPLADTSNKFFYYYGDGEKDSTGEHLYKAKGRYDVKIVVSAGNGCTDSLTKNIEVNESINAKFNLDTTDGCSPLHVIITPSFEEADTMGGTFKWQFGHDKVFKGPFPEEQEFTAETFDSTYLIKLTIDNVCGRSIYKDSVTAFATVNADFELETEWACAPLNVTLQNKTQGSMKRVSYLWDFGDGDTSTAIIPKHTFMGSLTNTTTYAIRLVASNKCGADTIEKALYVKPQNIKAQFSNNTKLGCTESEICFPNNSVGMSVEEPISQVSWDFGNGEVSNEWDGCTQFNIPGTYHVKLTINNACGQDEYESEIEIFEKPKIKIDVPKTICIGDSLKPKFSADVSIKGIAWDFGDGATSSFVSPTHIYNKPNDYMLKLNIVANNYGECKTSDSVEVIVPEMPIPEISPLEFSGCSPLRYEPYFDSQYYYNIDYEGNGKWTSAKVHDYINNSTETLYYNVSIVSENVYGCKAKEKGIVAVYPQPVAAIKKTVEEGYPEIVTFHNVSDHNNCYWVLPHSGVKYTCDSVKEEFIGNDEQTIILHVENEYGCSDEDTISHKAMMKGLYFPNTFIPGAENEEIATFNGVGIGLKSYLLEIFDMYGNLIYSTTSLDNNGSPNEGWDGKDRNGDLMPQDVYVWSARGIYEDGSVYPSGNSTNGQETFQRGSVLLLIK